MKNSNIDGLCTHLHNKIKCIVRSELSFINKKKYKTNNWEIFTQTNAYVYKLSLQPQGNLCSFYQ